MRRHRAHDYDNAACVAPSGALTPASRSKGVSHIPTFGISEGDRAHPRAALDAASVRNAYRRWAGVYDLVFGGVSAFGRRSAVAAVNRLSQTAGRRILEVGVGTGLALPHYRPDLDVVGIDLSREMLLKAKERVAAEKITACHGLIEMDAENTAFADDSFDIAVAMFTASVVPDAKKLFAEMSRVVRPGGHLLFVNHFAADDGFRWWLERTTAPLARILGWHPDFKLSDLLGHGDTEIDRMESCPPLSLFTLVEVKN
jgi:phosphatidylethanolamine/phosphatidyl-N-methylethanolamine N-methyltransferase